jgi:5-methyltetrahydropteroyltriglutamate--homocysteine methyltransferase
MLAISRASARLHETRSVVAYPAYTTTVIGAHSVPRWYELLDRSVTLGQLSLDDLKDAQFRTMQAAILEQAAAGMT